MADSNNAQNQQKYNKAKLLYDSVECLKKNSDKVKTLKRASKMFNSLGDFEDASTMAANCDADAKALEGKPDNLPPHPKNPMDEKSNSTVVTWIVRIAVILVFVGILGFFYLRQFDSGIYLRSSFYEAIGNHEKAYRLFEHVKDYKDANDKCTSNKYIFASKMLKEKKYNKAIKVFRTIVDYKDSGEKLTQAELKVLKKTPKHGDVLFGEAHWIVAEKKKDKAFLIKLKPTSGVAYNQTDEDVTWETSSIREYLNSSFMNELFTSSMIDKILETKVVVKDNKTYHTKGCKTKDKVFMLNGSQSYKYGEDLNMYLRDYWLISPGATQREAQFVSFGEVKEAGYQVTDRYMNIRPCMWVSFK